MRQIITGWWGIVLVCVSAYSAIIKPADVIHILVKDHEELSGYYTVSERGTIEYPLLADRNIANVTTTELMNNLNFILARHLEDPLVLVTVVDKPKIVVTVLGVVKNPGPVEAYEGVSLQEAIALAGGVTELADLQKVKIVPARGGEKNAEFYDLKTFLKSGNTEKMPLLRSDDKVIVLSAGRSRQVKVIGGVNKPGFFDITETLNIFEAIYLAGGPTEKADLSKVRRFFNQDGKIVDEIVDVQKFIDEGNMQEVPLVKQGDVIIVYTRWFDWKTMVSIINNALLLIVTLRTFAGT